MKLCGLWILGYPDLIPKSRAILNIPVLNCNWSFFSSYPRLLFSLFLFVNFCRLITLRFAYFLNMWYPYVHLFLLFSVSLIWHISQYHRLASVSDSMLAHSSPHPYDDFLISGLLMLGGGRSFSRRLRLSASWVLCIKYALYPLVQSGVYYATLSTPASFSPSLSASNCCVRYGYPSGVGW